MWSKVGRFVEGLRTVGDILTKISVKCVIKLHAALLFMCIIFWVIICGITIVNIFMGISCICCMYALLLLQYGFIRLHIYLYVYFLYIGLPQECCVCMF